jgi:serine/threonine-protein kinase HipA
MKELKVIYQGAGQSYWLGTLADDGHDVLFQYSPDALAQALELSPIRLPLRQNAYPDHQRDYLDLMRVPGLINDSLPDGWGLLLMDRRLKGRGIDLSTVSVLDRLAYLGENTMGALTYEPSTNALVDNPDLTLLELANEIQLLLFDDKHAVLDELARAGGSPGGARPKAAVYYNPDSGQMSTQIGHVPGGEPWLIKFPAIGDDIDSCAIEELYARMAHRCDLGMEATEFFQMSNGLTAFGTRRFDRNAAGRVHVHSLAGVLHANFRIPSLGYSEFMQATRRLTRDHRELKKALQRCVFNVLLNNRDDHAKNLAFLLNERKQWVLAPPFDLTYCAGYRGEHFMDVAGEVRQPGREHIIKVARAGGMKDKEAEAIIDDMLRSMSDLDFKAVANTLPISPHAIARLAGIIDGNRSRLAAS